MEETKQPPIASAVDATPAPNTSKKWPLLAAIAVLAAGLVAAAAVSFTNSAISDEALLRNAISNSMQKQTASLTYTTESEGIDLTITSDLDYSDIQNVAMSGVLTFAPDTPSTINPELRMDLVATGDGFAYVRLTEFDDGSGVSYESVLNTWVQFTSDISPIDLRLLDESAIQTAVFNAMIVGVFSLEGIATAVGEVPDGNFTSEQRDELLDIIDQREIYTIESASDAELDGVEHRKMTIEYSGEDVKALNEKVVEYSGADDDLLDFFADDTVDVYINTDTQRITRVEEVDVDGPTTRTNAGVNEDVKIAAPDVFISPEEFVALILVVPSEPAEAL